MANKNINEDNKATRFGSGLEAVSNGRKGGVASGEAKRTKKDLQYFARMMLDEIVTDKKGNEMPTRYAMLKAVLKKVLKDGDVKAYKAIAETADEMPRNKVDITSDGKALDRVIEIVVNKE